MEKCIITMSYLTNHPTKQVTIEINDPTIKHLDPNTLKCLPYLILYQLNYNSK